MNPFNVQSQCHVKQDSKTQAQNSNIVHVRHLLQLSNERLRVTVTHLQTSEIRRNFGLGEKGQLGRRRCSFSCGPWPWPSLLYPQIQGMASDQAVIINDSQCDIRVLKAASIVCIVCIEKSAVTWLCTRRSPELFRIT